MAGDRQTGAFTAATQAPFTSQVKKNQTLHGHALLFPRILSPALIGGFPLSPDVGPPSLRTPRHRRTPRAAPIILMGAVGLNKQQVL